MDKGAGKVSDCCRHLQQTFENFDEDLNSGGTLQEKWWWVCRRVRDIYEDFTGALMQKGLQYKSCQGAWALVCLEVYFRCCRDLAAVRYAVLQKEEYDAEELASLQNALKNYGTAAQHAGLCSFWNPLDLELLDSFQPSSGVETVLKSQTLERIEELQVYAKNFKGMQIFEGMNFKGVCSFAGSSS